MSASREKQARRERASSNAVSPKTAREAKQRQEERRSNLLYGLIAAALIVIVAASAVWNSNIIPRMTAAVTADGRNYNAAQVQFWYAINANATIGSWGYMASYLGLDTSTSLDKQTISDTAAEMLNAEPGITWKSYFLQKGIEQMVSAGTVLNRAAEEGYVFPDSVQEELDSTMAALSARAAASGLSVGQYIKNVSGSAVTTGIYKAELKKYLQYQDYVGSYYEGMSYTEEELEQFYEDNKDDYDLVSYQDVYIRGTALSTKDADGNDVQPTDEENAAAHEAADALSKEILSAWQAGTDLAALADGSETATYSFGDETAKDMLGTDLADWLFDADRKEGDAGIISSGENYYVAVFQGRHRDEQKTVDVRHILVQPEQGTLSEGDEGYEAEQEELKAAARAKAEELYQQWQDGEATEETFAALAQEETADSNGEDGGLYEKVYQGQMVTAFNDWCFDETRKHGDTGIVETDYGFHIMYFVGDNVPRWQTQAEEGAKSKDFNAWTKSLYDNAEITRKSFGMSFVD